MPVSGVEPEMSGTIALESVELSVGERDGSVLVPIVRTGDLTGTATVQYGVTPDTATAGVDYLAQNGTVTFAPGQARALVEIDILNDNRAEQTETFTFSIINVDSGFLAAPRTTRIDILDDENPVTDPVNPPLVSDYNVEQIDFIDGLRQPLAMEFGPQDSSLLYVAEKGGMIRVFDTQTNAFKADFIDLTATVNNIQDRGLLDIAFHPDFPTEPYLYAFMVVDPPESEGRGGNAGEDGGGNRYAHVVRYTADAANDYLTVVPNSGVVIVGAAGQSLSDISGNGQIDSTSNLGIEASDVDGNGDYVQDYLKVDSRSHAGGALEFGPDGALYISTGDGTSFNATDPRTVSVQDVDSLSGKVLRVDPLTGQGLADNPFVQAGASLDDNASKVFQLGLRNPFSMSFDQEGKLILTDTGWNSYEEINISGAGANFGWPFYEGGDNGQLQKTPGYRDLPEAQAFYAKVESGEIDITAAYRAFAHSNSEPGFQVQSIVGADDVINSDLYPEALQDKYIFADFTQGEVYAVDTNDRRDVEFLYQTPGGLSAVHFKQGPDGYIYALDVVRGTVKRLEITDPNGPVERTNGVLEAEYFEITNAQTQLDQINFNNRPVFTETVSELSENLTRGSFWEGGPTDNFAAKYTGAFEVETAGTYTFFLTSDDGSRLVIDGQQVIDNDFRHADVLQTVSLTLAAGEHAIDVFYFESGGEATLDLDWSGPGFARQTMVFDGEVTDPGDPTDPSDPQTRSIQLIRQTQPILAHQPSSARRRRM